MVLFPPTTTDSCLPKGVSASHGLCGIIQCDMRLAAAALLASFLYLSALCSSAFAAEKPKTASVQGQPVLETLDLDTIARIRDEGLNHSHIMEYASGLFDGVGPRLTGSPDFAKAQQWSLDQLRRMGERDYVEFTIAGKNRPQKIGNVTVELKGINQKRNQYSVVMTVEDKRFEKKNRALNEPVFFYTSGTRLPEELVINKVGKDQVSGYVSIPKANTQQAAATSTSGR